MKKEALLALIAQFDGRADFEEIYMISASTGDGVAELKAALAARVPEGPWHFPEDQVSDATDRMMAAEVTREQLYRQLHAELPYASAIETEKYEERKDGSVVIHQQILVGRDSQKAIVLGKGGTADQGDRRGRAHRADRGARPQGPPLPPRQGQPEMGGGPRALPRDRAGLGGVSPTSSRRR